MKQLPSMPPRRRHGIPIPQIRVLQALAAVGRGSLSKTELSEHLGLATTVVVGRAIGFSDPEKRRALEQTAEGGHCPSLLTLGYVRQLHIEEDGALLTTYQITAAGRAALKDLGPIDLPPLKR